MVIKNIKIDIYVVDVNKLKLNQQLINNRGASEDQSLAD